MSDTVTFTAGCGCVFDIDVYHDWVDGVTGVEDVVIVTLCKQHRPTPPVPAVELPADACPYCKGTGKGTWSMGGKPITTNCLYCRGSGKIGT